MQKNLGNVVFFQSCQLLSLEAAAPKFLFLPIVQLSKTLAQPVSAAFLVSSLVCLWCSLFNMLLILTSLTSLFLLYQDSVEQKYA